MRGVSACQVRRQVLDAIDVDRSSNTNKRVCLSISLSVSLTGDDPERNLRLPELGGVPRDDHVRHHHELAAAAERVAVDGRHDGLGDGGEVGPLQKEEKTVGGCRQGGGPVDSPPGKAGGRADYLVEHIGAEGLHEGLARHLLDVRAGRERLFGDWLKGSKILIVRPHPRVPLAPNAS